MEQETKKARARMTRTVAGPNKHSARQIQLLRKQAGMTQADLAKKVGVHQATVSKWEQGDDIPGGDTLSILASLFKVHPNEITGIGVDAKSPVGRRVQIIGEIAAGEWAETHEIDEPFFTTVPGLPSRFDRVQLQGFRVKGDSMNMVYPDGSIVYVAPIGAVSSWPKSGQVVMVMHHKHGETEATLKEYVENEHGKLLWPRSTHPAHQAPLDYKAKRGPDEEVVITGVVVAALVYAD
jgi:transcriptional regulator with XRE-family HTH domain